MCAKKCKSTLPVTIKCCKTLKFGTTVIKLFRETSEIYQSRRIEDDKDVFSTILYMRFLQSPHLVVR